MRQKKPPRAQIFRYFPIESRKNNQYNRKMWKKVYGKSYRLSEISDELAIESIIYFRLLISDCIPDLFGKKPKRTPLPNMKKPAKKGER